jgi:hypothetical protein
MRKSRYLLRQIQNHMANRDEDKNFIKEYQSRFDQRLRENEISVLEHWKAQLDKLTAMKPDGVGSLQVQIKRVSDMMANRIKILKRD